MTDEDPKSSGIPANSLRPDPKIQDQLRKTKREQHNRSLNLVRGISGPPEASVDPKQKFPRLFR